MDSAIGKEEEVSRTTHWGSCLDALQQQDRQAFGGGRPNTNKGNNLSISKKPRADNGILKKRGLQVRDKRDTIMKTKPYP